MVLSKAGQVFLLFEPPSTELTFVLLHWQRPTQQLQLRRQVLLLDRSCQVLCQLLL